MTEIVDRDVQIPRIEDYALPTFRWSPQPWRSKAACIGEPVEWFFIERGGDSSLGKAVCAECPVRVECLTWAMETEMPFGIFGGRAPRERRNLRRGYADIDICGTAIGIEAHDRRNESRCPACLGYEHELVEKRERQRRACG